MKSMQLSRAVARLAGSSLRLAAVRPALRQAVRFSSNESSVTKDLTQRLNEEIEAEKRLENENLGGAAQPTVPGFQLKTKDAEVRLTKKHGPEEILVVFNVNHSVDVEEDDPNSDLAPTPVALPPFSVEITKGSQRLCFNMILVETGDEDQFDFRVEEFYVAPAAKDGNEDVADEVYASSGKYIDPNLHDVLFVRYLEERGIDAEFCRNLVQFATHYEHQKYVGLLSQIRDFVSKN
ncbi:unnamed protein product [Bursaphelenchus xylophilus]|nr:unnamed protein product [Bursaphelenchus xylophilus]CAG9120953.1 unnamed protein product [Bursaphelenchus xylophilus]